MVSDLDRLIDQFSLSINVSLTSLIVSLVLAALLSGLLGYVYVRFGTAVSNRAYLARNFVMIAMTTTLIIMVVKSSLALSLGLVGALSIIRFRTAIKEPEELAFLFLTIAIGLGLGADQVLPTIVTLLLIMAIVAGRKLLLARRKEGQNLHLVVASNSPEKISLNQILSVLDKHCSAVNLKRLDESGDAIEASFLVDFAGIDRLNLAREELSALSKSVKITFLDYSGAP